MESNTIGRYTEHMGEELPEFTRATSGAIRYVDPTGRQRTAEEGQSGDRGGLQTVPGHLTDRNQVDVLRENGRRC